MVSPWTDPLPSKITAKIRKWKLKRGTILWKSWYQRNGELSHNPKNYGVDTLLLPCQIRVPGMGWICLCQENRCRSEEHHAYSGCQKPINVKYFPQIWGIAPLWVRREVAADAERVKMMDPVTLCMGRSSG